ncbi:hypothetical protein IPZ58_23385 [Streptomyces roseoverticillatus]|uniref:hypothetical protein n=1 Tax=Streptomyces roseoverticillatus TaxID=66429 RepID=UPI001F4178DA|nr:hypothetical protein [Streptomyces roseoverticillatus]MCF3104514.1 hypothetical protein [Streptomyces roseoverticillatus]
MLRLRIQYTSCRPALILTDTPDPHCRDCQGEGGHHRDYGDESGEYAGTEWEPCPCWDEARCWVLLPLPRLHRPRFLSRRHDRDPWGPAGYSDEPPF